jgi:ectoine hydroxylase-related dioxygenase (phytanoyl-CoA dioxygenase family)
MKGTLIIHGSHRIDVSANELAELVSSLAHQVVAPPGSRLLFRETLVHATSQITSDGERTTITTGYGPIMYPYWDDCIYALLRSK